MSRTVPRGFKDAAELDIGETAWSNIFRLALSLLPMEYMAK